MESKHCFYTKRNYLGAGNNNNNNNGNMSTGTKCGRWNPTTEQVKVLTELFRSGLRTPTTDQIQKISTQLSFYGKIESKNVFYWFQNHKARERQKRRKVSVDLDHNKDVIRGANEDKFPSTTRLVEVNNINDQVLEAERVMDTLQLFPLTSLDENCRESAAKFSYAIGTEMDHPPLDLRLSFM
ncbi:hypothetical protein ACFE04_030954 [Oxalis oulophora]